MRDGDQNRLIERIYEIAFEPVHLESLIEDWHDDGALAYRLGPADFSEHLKRAEVFLNRLDSDGSDSSSYLRGYEKFAALVVGKDLRVKATNPGAERAFGVAKGDRLSASRLPEDVADYLGQVVRSALDADLAENTLLRADLPSQRGAILLRVQKLDSSADVIIVSTQFQWSRANAKLLRQAFDLAEAEVDIVRRLVDGLDTKTIAEQRDTTVGTTRGQIKSILSKMNLRSQSDVVRIAVMLGEMPGMYESQPMAAQLGKDWLEAEVWKPFQTRDLPDGRKQTYHDMGPKDGAPVLLTHLGSCMVRWTKSMIRRAFEENLRIICPIRAGYGQSNLPKGGYDPFELTSGDAIALLDQLGISAVPYVVQGSDYPLAAHFVAHHPERVKELISIGGRPCLPGGTQGTAPGNWQRFFVSVASKAPHLADLALLEDPQVAQVLEANLALMSDKSSSSARAFSREYVAFQSDWSDWVPMAKDVPTKIFLASQDPTFDPAMLELLRKAYPWVPIETVDDAGLAMLYSHYNQLISAAAR